MTWLSLALGLGEPNRRVALQNIPPAMPAVEEMVSSRPERCLRLVGSTARVTFIGPNSSVSIWLRTCSGGEFLEEAGVEVARVVNQNVDAAKSLDGCLDRGQCVLGAGNVELQGQQVVVGADRRGDLHRIAASGDDSVAGGQRGPDPYPISPGRRRAEASIKGA